MDSRDRHGEAVYLPDFGDLILHTLNNTIESNDNSPIIGGLVIAWFRYVQREPISGTFPCVSDVVDLLLGKTYYTEEPEIGEANPKITEFCQKYVIPFRSRLKGGRSTSLERITAIITKALVGTSRSNHYKTLDKALTLLAETILPLYYENHSSEPQGRLYGRRSTDNVSVVNCRT